MLCHVMLCYVWWNCINKVCHCYCRLFDCCDDCNKCLGDISGFTDRQWLLVQWWSDIDYLHAVSVWSHVTLCCYVCRWYPSLECDIRRGVFKFKYSKHFVLAAVTSPSLLVNINHFFLTHWKMKNAEMLHAFCFLCHSFSRSLQLFPVFPLFFLGYW